MGTGFMIMLGAMIGGLLEAPIAIPLFIIQKIFGA
ncbi:hypothetical protein SAMN04488529_102402 [Clostridium gasigenes]|uniref:Uncharacterized protein n=1 Tax=Clostridium gasigenes TaxID=94869 RepID=A0A1H0QK23_9CLOT|nr:hypothetical protein SAMN04488529_102402 [Clostridium gasigenes]